MATRDGVRLIEYNARFGDPECLNLLTLLETDFVHICRAIVEGTLADGAVTFASKASVCKYVVPEGYPEKPLTGEAVRLPASLPDNVTLYLGSVDIDNGELVAAGSRTVAVVGVADTIAEAEALCESVAIQIPRAASSTAPTSEPPQPLHVASNACSLRGSYMSLRVGVLGSTRGTALQGVIDAIAAGTLDAEIALIISDRAAAPILQRAIDHQIPYEFLSPPASLAKPTTPGCPRAFQQTGAELILMVGYMRIVSPAFVATWNGRLLNVHPSLLPAFGGLMNKSVHEAVLAAGVTETGCTIHQVTDDVDAGPIVLQKKCAVLPDDTVEALKDRVQALEQAAFVEVLRTWRA